MIHTILYLTLSVLFAITLWIDRPVRAAANAFRLLRTVLLCLLPIGAFVGVAAGENGSQLTLRITELRVPLAAVLETPSPRTYATYLIVGDRAETADLVVPPYADQGLSRVSMPAEARALMVLEARAAPVPNEDGGEAQGLQARLTLRSFAGDADAAVPGLGVSIDGVQVAPGQTREIDLAAGAPVRISVARIDADGKWAPRRAFSIVPPRKAGDPVRLTLETPLKAGAGSCEAPRLRLAPMTGADAAEAAYRDPENLVFNGLGRGGVNPVAEPRWLGPVGAPEVLCAQARTRLLWPVGVEADAARMEVTGQKVFLPWYALLFTVLTLLATHMICSAGWRAPTAERVVVPLVQWFLTLRLLIAIAGVYNDSRLGLWEVLWDPLSALVCLPALIVAALRPGGAELRPVMASLAGLVVFAFAGLLIASGLDGWTPLLLVLYAATLAVLAIRVWRPEGRAPLHAAALLVERLRRAIAARLPTRQDLPASLSTGLALLAAIVAARIGLSLVGALLSGGGAGNERILGIPLSLAYVPAAILAFALILDGVARLRSRGLWPLWVSLAFAAAYVVVPVVTRDAGVAMVFGVPVGLVIARVALARLDPAPSGPEKLVWLAPALAVPGLIAAVAVGILLLGDLPSPDKDLGGHLAAVTDWDRNGIRLLGFVANDRVAQLGTKYAFEWLDLAAGLGPLTQSLWGQGYLTPSHVQPAVLFNQYMDNLTAIHIVWPLGRLGVLGALVVLSLGLAALSPFRPGETPSARWPALVSLLAGVTLFWTAAYMALANLNWVPFTGRNVYLLAVTSGGDLAEGLALFLLAAVALAVRLAPGARS